MLERFLKNAIKHPGKLLALCFVVYIATMSFVVSGLLGLLAIGWVRAKLKEAARAHAAAQAEAQRAEVAKATVVPSEPSVTLQTVTVAPATNDASAVKAAPARQYARSAVVIPFRSGTR